MGLVGPSGAMCGVGSRRPACTKEESCFEVMAVLASDLHGAWRNGLVGGTLFCESRKGFSSLSSGE